MKIFLKKLVVVLLPAFSLIIAFELLARSIPTSYGAKHDYLMEKKDKIKILVSGSSHANFGINPQYFEQEAFNISNTSQCLYQDYSVLSKYLAECKNVKTVIVPISYFTLQSDLALSPEAWRCKYYSVYMGVKGDASSSPFEIGNLSALVLWDGPVNVLKSLRKVKKVNINNYGFQSLDGHEVKTDDTINDSSGKARVGYHDQFMKKDLLVSNLVLLNKLAGMLREKNIKMVLVTTPVYKTYYQHVTPQNYNLMVNSLEVISKRHKVDYYNYFSDARFEISDFLDNDHLNEEGAKKFSIILKNDILAKMI